MLKSEEWKTKLLLCFCETFQAGNFQAGRQAQDLSEWVPSIMTHFTPPHVPHPWASTQQGGGWCGLEASPWVCVFQCLCVSICKYKDGMVSVTEPANVRLPPRSGGISEPGHTKARRRVREKEMDFAVWRPPPRVCWSVCAEGWHGAWGRRGVMQVWAAREFSGGIQSATAKQICCLPPGPVKHRSWTMHMYLHGGCTQCLCLLVFTCTNVHKEEQRKQSLRPL